MYINSFLLPTKKHVRFGLDFVTKPNDNMIIVIERVVDTLRGRFHPTDWEVCKVDGVIDAAWDVEGRIVEVLVELRNPRQSDAALEALKTMLNRACKAEALPYTF